MIEKDYILLILNCHKYKYKSEYQKKIWLDKIPDSISYFHIIGNATICGVHDYIFDNDNHILYVNTKDDYMSLPHKIIMAIKAIHENYKYKYIFKTDDDQMLIKDTFFDTVIKLLTNGDYHYGGFTLEVKDHISTYWTVHNFLPKDLFLKGTKYCNGRFYLLSCTLIEDLLKHKDQIKTHIMEDHAIGLYIDEKYKQNILKINTNSIFIDIEKYTTIV